MWDLFLVGAKKLGTLRHREVEILGGICVQETLIQEKHLYSGAGCLYTPLAPLFLPNPKVNSCGFWGEYA